MEVGFGRIGCLGSRDLHALRTHTDCTVYTYRLYSVHIPTVQCTHTDCTVYTYRLYSVHIPTVQCTLIIYGGVGIVVHAWSHQYTTHGVCRTMYMVVCSRLGSGKQSA